MKKSFSQRVGLKPVRTTVQLDSIDQDLRSRLWDILTEMYWAQVPAHYLNDSRNLGISDLLRRIWHEYFKRPIDTIGPTWPPVLQIIRKYFFSCEWNEVYDFIEFVAANSNWASLNASFRQRCNDVLKKELSAFRFVGDDITAITSEEEIAEIEIAANLNDRFRPVTEHIRQAMRLLSDRKAPDYRNSIKEAISAVEAVCQLVTGSQKMALGEALKKMEPKLNLHPAMREAFLKLYGYASDAEGIRHALLDESSLKFEDAKYMVVTCSAFINYLGAKSV